MDAPGLLPFLVGRGRYQLLLLSMVTLTVLSAVSRTTDELGPWPVQFAVTAVLAAGVWATRGHRAHLVAAAACVAVNVVAVGVASFATASVARIAAEAEHWSTLGITVILFDQIMRDLLRRSDMHKDDILGAACGYGVLGLAAKALFAILQLYQPGSFQVEGEPVAELTAEELLYYSFTVLTTLGFGDITPVSPIAQTVSVFEATAGQLYLTIVVALLVGRRLAHYRELGSSE